jgi:ABC-type multidrug transport system fused ATPase/permease subunit
LQIYDEFSNPFPDKTVSKSKETGPTTFKGEVSVKNINFNYADSEIDILNNVSIEIKSGTMVALVGASGMGKSTFVDLILGIISPKSGKITISGMMSNDAVKKWPGAIAYVPQNISIINGTIKENITLGYLANEVSDNEIQAALISAQLDEFVNSLPRKENTVITENGQNLSGGQKQKIGIARALLSNPGLIILDEATSSLDSRSEFEIMKVINNLRNKVTLIIVAHRLSTVKDADQIIYFGANTHVVAENFTDLVNSVADFKEQASLLGL